MADLLGTWLAPGPVPPISPSPFDTTALCVRQCAQIVYGSYGILETGFPLSSIIPYYNVLKLVMFIYLYHSTTKGATMVSARARQRGRVGDAQLFCCDRPLLPSFLCKIFSGGVSSLRSAFLCAKNRGASGVTRYALGCRRLCVTHRCTRRLWSRTWSLWSHR